jgi:hypothetical protein
MGGIVNWTHVGSIRIGGLAGEAPDDGRRRGSGGASAVARVLAQCGPELGHVQLWELEWRLGSRLEPSVGHGHDRRRELTGDTNGGRCRTGLLAGACKGKEWVGYKGRAARRGIFARASLSTGTTAWARRRLATCGGPPANGGHVCGRQHVRGSRVAPS